MRGVGISFIKPISDPTITNPLGNPLVSSAPPSPGGSTANSFTTDQAAKQITRKNLKWQDVNGDGAVKLTYSLSKLTSGQQEQVRRSLQVWADVSNITFSESHNGADGKLMIEGDSSQENGSGYAFMPGGMGGSYVELGIEGAPDVPVSGGLFRKVALHEIGHAIGLSHTSDEYGENVLYAEDSKAYSAFSGRMETHNGSSFVKHGRYIEQSGPMMHDIAAAQLHYGANYKTRSTDTTYGFNSNTDRDYFSLKSDADAPVFCVWDGGGIDTLDFSGFSQDQNINLNAESFSDVGGMKGNVSIAKGCTIENAIGGAGRDNVLGNEAANRIKGGGKGDSLTGGGGADTFVYDKASDSTPTDPDMIEDFTSGTDTVDVSGALKEAGVRALVFTDRFSGRAGEAVLKHDPSTGLSSLAIDLKGTGSADLLLKSKGEIKPADIAVRPGVRAKKQL